MVLSINTAKGEDYSDEPVDECPPTARDERSPTAPKRFPTVLVSAAKRRLVAHFFKLPETKDKEQFIKECYALSRRWYIKYKKIII
jgi:hypothetical protein